MAFIKQLTLQHFRNIDALTLDELSNITLITGDNGAGKSSVLEAIYYLSFGRSFRSSRADELCQHHASELLVRAQIIQAEQHQQLAIGRKRGGQKQMRLNGERCPSFATMAKCLPLQFVGTHSPRFFTDGPSHRRQFFDWSCFHSDDGFHQHWQRWQHALKQRNAALKARAPWPEISAWDEALINAADAVNERRQHIVAGIQPYLEQWLTALNAPNNIALSYAPGWPEDKTLQEALHDSRWRDQQIGYTTIGPQRADYLVTVNGLPAAACLSQGQQKLVIYAMHMAQNTHFHSMRQEHAIVLMDDLPSELDQHAQTALLSALTSVDAQLFITSITADALSYLANDNDINLIQLSSGKLIHTA